MSFSTPVADIAPPASTRFAEIAPAALCALASFACAVDWPLASAQLASDSTVFSDVGERTGLPEPADGHGPPSFAYAACVDKVSGDDCSVSFGDRTLAGSCVTGLNEKLFCLPDTPTTTRIQAIADLVQWAKATPNVLSQAPADGLTGYLVSKFPCKRGK